MSKPNIAIIKSIFHDNHTSSWGKAWEQECVARGLHYHLLDWRGRHSYKSLLEQKIVLWHFSHYSFEEMKFARSILTGLKRAGCIVFPDAPECEHFDDKIAQAYLLKALDVATPENHVFYTREEVDKWIEEDGEFPVVAKLKGGSGSAGVTLLRSKGQLREYAKAMLGAGIRSQPSIIFKIKSNIRSARTFSDIIKRLRRASDFSFSLSQAVKLDRERGYVYLQKYIPNLKYDFKVVVVGDKLSYICRSTRPDDFRASGSGALFFDRRLITDRLRDVAFQVSGKLNALCMGYDIVIDPTSHEPLILEMSYGFSHKALLEAGGYFDREGFWHEAPLNAPAEVLSIMLARAAAQ